MSSKSASVEPVHCGTHGGPGVSGPLVPAGHVQPISVQRPAHGNEDGGKPIKVITNHFELGIKLDQGTIYHYDGMSSFFSKTSIE